MTASLPLPRELPRLSVLLPVFNAARTLQQALDSLTTQTFGNFELLAVNDGSSDASEEILLRHALRDPRLRVISRPNTGIIGALNEALSWARGPFVARMDADDEAAPQRFSRQIARMDAEPGLVALGSAVTFMDERGHSVQACPRPTAHAEIERALLGGDGGALIHPSVMFRAEAVRTVGCYRLLQPQAQYYEDLDLFLRLARIGRLANLPESLLRYRVHAGSINFQRHADRHAVKLAVLREAHAARGLPFDPAQMPDESAAHADPARHAREWAASALALGPRRVAVSHGWRAVRLRPFDPASWRALRYALTAPVPLVPFSRKMPHLLYIGQTPAEGSGSPIIILRHLQRLAAAGWRISVIAENGQDLAACLRARWSVLMLPLRRFWWPPFRRKFALSRTLRTWLLAGECRRLTADRKPDAVLGYLAAHDDFYAEIATRYAERSGLPLSLLVHDDAAAFATTPAARTRLHRRHAWMFRRAHRSWFVSPELGSAYGLPPAATRVLPPLPAGRPDFGRWQPRFLLWPRVYYAGFIWPAQFPLLREIAATLEQAGASLVLLTAETPELAEFLRTCPLPHVAPFATNHEALTHLAREAAGVLVSYAGTIDQMPWTATSFPSKLVEYAQLGLPCAIVAPPESAVGRWAARTGYQDFFIPADRTGLGAWARDLRHEPTWHHRSQPTRELAGGDFSPERIQAEFAAGLLRS